MTMQQPARLPDLAGQPREHENDECNAEYPKCRGGHEDAGSFPGCRSRPLEA
jgi:hypothetical protein